MAFTYDTETIGLNPPFNVYSNVTDADVYFAAHIGAAAWVAAVTLTKQQALITATRALDRMTWQGTKTDADNALAWPRSGVTDSRTGEVVDEDELPADLIAGVQELALALVVDPTVLDKADQGSNIASVTAGPVAVSFFRQVYGPRFPIVVDELLGRYLSGSSDAPIGEYSGANADGEFDESQFDDADRYDVGEPVT